MKLVKKLFGNTPKSASAAFKDHAVSLSGIGAISAGAFLLFLPAGFVVLGVLLLVFNQMNGE